MLGVAAHRPRTSVHLANLTLLALLGLLGLGPSKAPAQVQIVRDTWGIPHVFAASDTDAMFGLGYAAAEDRAFQMYFHLRIMQGRSAEVLRNAPRRGGRERAVQHDRKMRTFGFWRHAQQLAPALDAPTRTLLQAYADGVNAWLQTPERKLPEIFAAHDLEPEPWSPAACLASWNHVAQFFATDGTRDLIAWRNHVHPRPGRPTPPRVAPDESAAVVQRGDVSDAWLQRVTEFKARHGIGAPQPAGEARKWSHAWVVGGARTTTGAAVLVSDPQTPVRNPNLFWEFHVKGATFDARGIGVAGSPVILIGFNRTVAWGVTALGADQADLFRLRTDPAHPGQYMVDDEWLPFAERTERIAVRGGATQRLVVRESIFGPVVSEFSFRRDHEAEVAVKRVPLCDRDLDTASAAFAMLRATNASELLTALRGWRFPSMNAVFGDAAGHIGFTVAGAFPIRSRHALRGGRFAHDGSARRFDWQGFVPPDLVPWMLDPRRGFVQSANHRPIGAFYDVYLGNTTGALGDTVRSWRLRELLTAKERFTPADVLAVHHDTTNPARREVVRLGLYLRDVLLIDLDESTQRALEVLEPWLAAGASSDLRHPGAALATTIDLQFRFVTTPLTGTHGGGLSGLARWLKNTASRLDAGPDAAVTPDEIDYVERILAEAWDTATERYGRDPALWGESARAAVRRQRLGYQVGLDAFASLDREHDLALPGLTCLDGSTIAAQGGQTYTQWVPLHDVDQARSILPPGQSERPGAASRWSTLDLWERRTLHPAPLSRGAVDKIAVSSRVLRR